MLSLLGLLATAVLVAHSPATAAHAGMEGESPVDAMTACLAILMLAGSVALLAVACRPETFARWSPPRDAFRGVLPLLPDRRVATWARAGPAALQVFRL